MSQAPRPGGDPDLRLIVICITVIVVAIIAANVIAFA